MKSYVYFIVSEETKRVKISKSNKPKERMMDLQVGSSTNLKLAYTIECSSEQEAFILEKHLQEKYKDLAVMGEWFTIIPEMFNEINVIDERIEMLLSNEEVLLDYLKTKVGEDMKELRLSRETEEIIKELTAVELRELKLNKQRRFLVTYVASFLSQIKNDRIAFSELKTFVMKNINRLNDGTKKLPDNDEYCLTAIVRDELKNVTETTFKTEQETVGQSKRPTTFLVKVNANAFKKEHSLEKLPEIYKEKN